MKNFRFEARLDLESRLCLLKHACINLEANEPCLIVLLTSSKSCIHTFTFSPLLKISEISYIKKCLIKISYIFYLSLPLCQHQKQIMNREEKKMLPLVAMYENQGIPKGIKTIIQY